MEQVTYLESVICEMLEQQKYPNFIELDEIFKDKNFPKVISDIIYEYAHPYCPECSSCCSVCKLYCFNGCLRLERDLCCKYELGRELLRYDKKPTLIFGPIIESNSD